MFFREDMNFSIIDGCDDEAAGQDLRFSVRNKKETNRKKQALTGSIRRTATTRTVFPDLLPCRRPQMPRHFFIGQNTCPKKQERRCMNMVICRTACILWQTAMSFPWHSQTKRRSGTTKEQKTGLPVTPELPARVLSGFSDHDAAVIRRPVQDPIEHLFPKKK